MDEEEKNKKYHFNIKDFSDIEIDIKHLKDYLYLSYGYGEDLSYNPKFDATSAVKSSMLDMSVILGMKRDGSLEIIKNEKDEGEFKYVNIDTIMKMFIKAIRTGILRFPSEEKFKLFSDTIEKELENAIMGVVNKYDLKRHREYNYKWPPKQSLQKTK